nr:reverse transcriptase domain-containing protein [Tanacetum cinerariifolium]
MKRRLEKWYDLIENMTAHHNDWDTSAQRSESSSSITSSFDTKIAALKAEMVEINKNLIRVLYVNQQVKAGTLNCETCGGPYSFNDCPATVGNTQNVYDAGAYQGNTITNPKEDLKGITTRSGTAYQGPMIPTTSSSSLVVERETGATKDTLHPTNNESTKDVQPQVVLTESQILNSEPVVAPIIDLVASLVTLADLDASINLMPLSVWNKLSLPDLSPTCMTLELADHSISRSVGVAEDVFVKVGTFQFPADFVVVDFDADPRVPLFLGRYFLKTRRDLIDVFEGELTLRVGKEAITFNLYQTSRYSANYNDMTANRIDVIGMACEEYSQKVLSFFDVIASGNPTPYYDSIVSTTSPTLTPFGNSDFLLEEVDAFLALEDDPTSPKVYQSYVDTEGDILLLEAFLNDDPSLLPLNQGNYLPQVKLKDLPPHLEYVFLEGDDKFPVVIVKDLSVKEKTALITVLKSHKRAIAWKLSDIKGIDPEFCTHKILMDEDFEPAVQHQRRVNPKIHDVIKNEVLKLLDAGLIYPISDSPWVSPVYCIPKKGGFTVVENEENELILTRLVTGWRVRIDYWYFQIPIDLKDQEKTTFTCPYRTFAYRRMPFGLCNAPCTFQRCMMAIFHDMIEKTMEVFMDDFSEKSHFMVKEGIVLGHKISKNGIEVYKAKVDVIAKLPHLTTVKGIRSFLGHAGFYRRFIQDFSKIARPMTRLLEKDTSFLFSKECVKAFQTLKRKLTEAPILITLDWDMPFELMCDASDFAIGAVLEQCQEKHFRPIHYASKTMTEAESNYTTTKKEMLAVIKSSEGVYTGRKPLTFSRLDTMDPPGDITAQITQPIRIGTLRAIISNRGTHFCNDQFAKVMLKFGVTHHLATPYQPQTSGQVESPPLQLKTEDFSGKLKSRWSGPFTISHVFPNGTVELSQPDGPNFKVNGHRLKHYFREDVPKMVVLDLQTFPKDQ